MHEDIEISIELTEGGIADCRLEPEISEDDVLTYSATILYPQVINGYNRSDIYCYTMSGDHNNEYCFVDNGDGIHPKIMKLEDQLTTAIGKHLASIGYRR